MVGYICAKFGGFNTEAHIFMVINPTITAGSHIESIQPRNARENTIINQEQPETSERVRFKMAFESGGKVGQTL